MNIVCDVCGNERENLSLVCPFCGSTVDDAELKKPPGYVHKSINLEAGRPVVKVALNRLNEIIEDSVRNNVNVLTLIHGYGSSGKGGAIRLECRKTLDFLKSKGLISAYIAGEDFNKRSGLVKSLLQRYPQLVMDKHLNRGNRGITLVIFTLGAFVVTKIMLKTILNATILS